MLKLSNDRLTAVFDEQGRLCSLWKAGCPENVLAAPARESFSLVFKRGEDWENAAFGNDQTYRTVAEPGKLTFQCDRLQTKRGEAEVTVRLTVELTDDTLHFSGEIENRDDVLITDFTYPILGEVASLGGDKPPALLWPFQCGTRINHIGAYLRDRNGSDPFHPGQSRRSRSISTTYPGGEGGSMQWMALTDDATTLSFSGRDPLCYASVLQVEEGTGEAPAAVLQLTRLPFVQPGETWASPPVLVSLYTGNWRRAAREYRTWADTWRPQHVRPRWIEEMQGYFLVILKQQFGDEMWNYREIPKLYALARAHGFDALGLFGWYASGHDNQYPDLQESESMGGRAALETSLEQVRAQGGHATLYHQGHLMDVTSEFYREHGAECESVSRWGTPYYEAYNKAHTSRFLSHFTNKQFSTACPSSPRWQELMEEKARWIASFGPNGVLFDQIGGMYPYPCFHPDHPHALGKPSLSMSQGRVRLMDRIQKQTKALDPEFAFMTEHVTDVYSAYADCLHGINLYPSSPQELQAAAAGDRPVQINYPQLFRYCFPETPVTLRNSRPYISQRAVNFCFLFGLKFEMEIRYAADREDLLRDAWPVQRVYAQAVSGLRKRYWDVLGGEFIDEDGLQVPPGVYGKGFRKDRRLAVALWNDGIEPVSLSGLHAPGYRLVECGGIGETRRTLKETMAPGEILVALFEKEAD